MSVQPPGVTSILQAVEKRGETDTHPSYFVHVVLGPLIVLATLLVVASVVYYLLAPVTWSLGWISERLTARMLGGLVALVGLSILAAMVLGYWGLYRLIRRRNEHLGRDRVLRRGLLDYCRRLAEQQGGDRVGENLGEMERIHNEALLEEAERPAAVHVALTVFTSSLWLLYIIYFLAEDLAGHARRQARFVREARSLFENVGLDPEHVEPVEPADERSPLLAVALAIPPWGAIGFFVVAWWLFEDPPVHFARQWEHEDGLVEFVEEAGDQVAAGPEGRRQAQAPPSPGGEPDEEPSDGDQEGDDGGEGTPETDEDEFSGGEAEESEPAPEPEFTIWECGECGKKYKVPPKRPVRVTCKNCENKEILEE